MRRSKYLLAAIPFLLASCSLPGPNQSQFLQSFDPAVLLSRLGSDAGLSYSSGLRAQSVDTSTIEKHWDLSFQGSRDQLAAQLDKFKATIETGLTTSGATLSDRGKWSGNFSGFRIAYSSRGRHGFVRVTGASLENQRQAIEILVYEYP